MVPLRLTLRNFICYGEDVPILDLEPVHVACLSGQNGHGKSALLDAITWAVWGRARARTHDELIHQGKSSMSVELELSARGQRYRILRRYSRPSAGRQGTTLLDLQASSGNGYRAITGNTVRDTEALIRDVVHMDYDTFVNTAFLLQGRADMFTRSKPSQRKECLAEVLDLSYYDDLEQRAKAQSTLIQDYIKEADIAITQLRSGLEAREEHQAILEEARASIERLAPAVEAARARVDSQRGRVELLRNMGKERDVLKARAAAGRSEIDALDRQRRGYEGRAAEYHALTERREEILQGFGGLDTARRESERLDDVHRRLLTLQSGKARLEQEVAVQRERLSAYLAQLSSNIENGLEPTASRLPAIGQAIADMESEENALEAGKADYARMVGEAHDLSLTIESLEAANTVLREEMSETRQKFDILQREDAECPVCRQLLRPDDRDHVRAEYERQGKKALNRYRDNAAEQDRLRETHSRLATKVSRLEVELSRDARELTRKRTELERDRRDSITARQQLDLALAESEKERARLENEAFAEAERAELARIDARIAEMDYAPDAHNAARRQARELGPYEELIRKLREAEKRLPEERRDLGEVAAMLERRRAETAEDEERAARLGRDIVALPSMEAELRGMEDSLTAKERELEAARVQQGISTEELARLDRLEAEAKEREKKRNTLADQKGVYDELAVAFGKNGVQALIIEAAIPQLEDDANQLLSRLTDNRMSIRLQLRQGRRERRMGLPSEELDIRVGDEMGTRSYETFSGGEAFRIDFSLRIALSKLLARRSGAPLPILFIDEGFGSQDAAGQERLKEAIQSIQDDFRKIIVITHIDEIKESFPTRIEVTKTPTGSTFAVA